MKGEPAIKTETWRVEKTIQFHRDPIFYHTDVISGGTRVARVAGIGEEESREHAHLIASAPKMLSALKSIRRALDESEGCQVPHFLENAIAKAEGKA